MCKKSTLSGKKFVCQELNDCNTAIQDIRDNVKYPTICSFKGKIPVVCCAPESMLKSERLSKDKDILPGLTREYNDLDIIVINTFSRLLKYKFTRKKMF